jgi:hypothetical protein
LQNKKLEILTETDYISSKAYYLLQQFKIILKRKSKNS